jgi:hypothetical protein
VTRAPGLAAPPPYVPQFSLPDKNPVTRAKANLLAFQFDNNNIPPWVQLAQFSAGDDQSIQAFLASVEALNPYLDDD